jgi:hypothetical protein
MFACTCAPATATFFAKVVQSMSVDVIMWHQAVLPSTVIYLTVQRHVRAQLPAMPLTTSTAHSVRDPYKAAVLKVSISCGVTEFGITCAYYCLHNYCSI